MLIWLFILKLFKMERQISLNSVAFEVNPPKTHLDTDCKLMRALRYFDSSISTKWRQSRKIGQFQNSRHLGHVVIVLQDPISGY